MYDKQMETPFKITFERPIMPPDAPPDFEKFMDQVEELVGKIMAVAEGYKTPIVMDALETMFRAGAGLLGEEEGELLSLHLNDFHRESAMLMIVRVLGSRDISQPVKDDVASLVEQLAKAQKSE